MNSLQQGVSKQNVDNAVPYSVQIYFVIALQLSFFVTTIVQHGIMPCKNEYEKTNILSRCDIRLTSNSHLRRRTDVIVKGSYCATSSTPAA